MLSDELSNIKPEFAHQLAVEHFVFGFLKAVSIRRYLAGLAEPKEREELEAFFTKCLKPKLLDKILLGNLGVMRPNKLLLDRITPAK